MDEKAPSISVFATGETTVAPDLAVVSLAVSAMASELAPTRDDVNRRSSAVLGRLRELGLAEADISAPDVVIQPEYDYRKGQRLIGYRVARQVTVRVRGVERLGDVLDGVVAAGANEVQGARMSPSDPAGAEHVALGRAVEAARAKAGALAAAAGVSLGRVLEIEEEPSFDGPRFRMAAAEAADASTEVVTGELTISCRIRARFAIS
ncbi:SIMPL domain-containing protein [soil metagenome]